MTLSKRVVSRYLKELPPGATDCFPDPDQRPTAYPTTEWNIDKHWDGSPIEASEETYERPLVREVAAALEENSKFVEGFFKRHSKLRVFSSVKVVEKSSGGAAGHPEASQHGGEILLFPKFWKLNAKTRDFVFAHELGHYALSEYGLQKAVKVAQDLGVDPWDNAALPFGQFNMDEAFADCFASYHLEPGELKSKAPAWIPIVEAVLGKAKIAALVTLDQPWVEKLRKDFLTLMKNIPRLKDYQDALTLKKAINFWTNNFEDMFFKEFLNNTLKYGYEQMGLREQDAKHIGEKLRKSGWDLTSEFSSMPFLYSDNYYPQESRFRNFQNDVGPWDKRVRRKAQVFWKELENSIHWFEKIRFRMKEDPEHFEVDMPDVDQVTLEGFQTVLKGYDPQNRDYLPDALEAVKWGLRDYRQKAKQRLPLLIQKQLPLVIDFKGSLDTGGEYHGSYIWLNGVVNIGNHESATRITKTLAHEMGHHIYKSLSKEADELWYALIRGDYGDIDLREVLAKWPESKEWAMDFTDSIRESDPILSLQVDTVAEGYEPGGFSGRGLDKREDFVRLLERGEATLRVPSTPITAYAGKNPEEAFCETIGMLVAFGPRAVDEKIRHWLDVVLPGQVKLARGGPTQYGPPGTYCRAE